MQQTQLKSTAKTATSWICTAKLTVCTTSPTTKVTTAIRPYVRFGFKGETQITDQLTGYGQWEYNVQANHSESQGTEGTKTRLGFAGLKFADYGSFDYGRNYGVLVRRGRLDRYAARVRWRHHTYTDNFMTGRTNGVATYRNNNFFGLVDGLNFALQYQGKTRTTVVTSETKRRRLGISSTYDIGEGVSFGAAYLSLQPYRRPETAFQQAW